jgi:hypothetical protein
VRVILHLLLSLQELRDRRRRLESLLRDEDREYGRDLSTYLTVLERGRAVLRLVLLLERAHEVVDDGGRLLEEGEQHVGLALAHGVAQDRCTEASTLRIVRRQDVDNRRPDGLRRRLGGRRRLLTLEGRRLTDAES